MASMEDTLNEKVEDDEAGLDFLELQSQTEFGAESEVGEGDREDESNELDDVNHLAAGRLWRCCCLGCRGG